MYIINNTIISFACNANLNIDDLENDTNAIYAEVWHIYFDL